MLRRLRECGPRPLSPRLGTPIRELQPTVTFYERMGLNVFYNHLTLVNTGGRFVWLFQNLIVTDALTHFVDACYLYSLRGLPHNIVHERPSDQAVLHMALKKCEEDGEGLFRTVMSTDMNHIRIEVVQELLLGLTRSLFTLCKKFGAWTVGKSKPELYAFPPFCQKLIQLLQRVPEELKRDPKWIDISGRLLKHHLMGVLVCSYTQGKMLAALERTGGPVDLVRAFVAFIRYARENLNGGYRSLRNNVFNRVRVDVPRRHKRPKVRAYKPPPRGFRSSRPARIRTDLPVHMPKVAYRVCATDNRKQRYGWD